MAISPDGATAWVSFAQDDAVVAVDLNTMTHLAGVDLTSVGVMLDSRTTRLNAAGNRLFVANHGTGNVMVIDTATATVVGVLSIEPNHGDCIHAAGDGRMLVTSMAANQAYLHVVGSATLGYTTYTLTGLANAWVAPSPSNPEVVHGVALVGTHPNYTSVLFTYNLSSSQITAQTALTSDAQPGDTECSRIIINPAGDRLYSGWMKISDDHGYGNLTAFDLDSFSVLSSSAMDNGVADMSMSPVSGKIYITGFWTGQSSPGTLPVIEYDPAVLDISNRWPVADTGDQRGVAVHPTDPNVVFAVEESGNRLYGLDLSTGLETARVAFNEPGVSPYYIESGDGLGFVLCHDSDRIYKINLDSGLPPGSIPLPNGWPDARGVSAGYHNGSLYLAGWGTVYRLDPSDGSVEGSHSLGSASLVSPLRFFGNRMAALQLNPADNTTQKLLLYDADTMSLLDSSDLPAEEACNKLSVSPDGTKLYWTSGYMFGPATIHIHDAATLDEINSITIAADAYSGGSSTFSQTVFDPAASKAYMLGWQSIYVLDMNTDLLLQTLDAVDLQDAFGRTIWYPGGLAGIAFSPDKSHLRFVSGDVHSLFTYDLSTAQWSTEVVNLGGYFTTDACLSPDGTRMFTVNQYSGSVSVLDLAGPGLNRVITLGAPDVDMSPLSLLLGSQDAWSEPAEH